MSLFLHFSCALDASFAEILQHMHWFFEILTKMHAKVDIVFILSAPMPDNSHNSTETKATIFVLGTTDLHMQLLAYDYFADRPTDLGGLIPLAREIERIRAVNPSGTFLFDNGDFLQGNPLADFSASAQTAVSVHPMVQAMNTLKYDAVCLGNHEFNYGVPFLKDVLKSAEFAIVCANIKLINNNNL